MVIDMLYFLFPRLSKNLRSIEKKVDFGNGKIWSKSFKHPLQPKRRWHSLRFKPMNEDACSFCAGNSGCDTKLFSVVGTTSDGQKIDFRFFKNSRHGVEFTADEHVPFVALEVKCLKSGIYDLTWVCDDVLIK